MADRNVVIKSIENCLYEKGCDDCSYEGCIHAHGNCTGDLMADALELLKEQPKQKFFVDSDGKVTPLPIQKHGHWKGFTQSRYFGTDDDGEPIFRDGVFYVCSECRRKSIIKYPYCPRCGAKMEEEVKQNG